MPPAVWEAAARLERAQRDGVPPEVERAERGYGAIMARALARALQRMRRSRALTAGRRPCHSSRARRAQRKRRAGRRMGGQRAGGRGGGDSEGDGDGDPDPPPLAHRPIALAIRSGGIHAS